MRAMATTLGAAAVALMATAVPAHAGSTGVETQLLASFDSPTYVAAAPGRARYLYVTEKRGVVRVVRDGAPVARPFLNIADLVADDGEQGLLSIAFGPDHRKTRRVYVYYTASAGCTAAGGCPIRVDEFKVKRGDPARALRSSRRRVIRIPHPDAGNHNGGTVAFGPDGKLWLATGDGGGGGDQFEQARDPESLLGKLLRINPRSGAPDRPGYRVPPDNPFVGSPGHDEIWSYGLRNPFRFSFDPETGTVAIGDVGQGTQEEVSIVTIADVRAARRAALPAVHLPEPALRRQRGHRRRHRPRPRSAAARGPLRHGRFLRGTGRELRPRPGEQPSRRRHEPRHRTDFEPRSIRVGIGRTALRSLAERGALQTGV
jgi:glucose/arabinose dehydrogenase